LPPPPSNDALLETTATLDIALTLSQKQTIKSISNQAAATTFRFDPTEAASAAVEN
jgi:hypothetical protein